MLTGCSEYPRQFYALELGAVEQLAAVCETRFNVGFDFATILSFPVTDCILFDIYSGQLAELKNAGAGQMEKMIPFVTCEIDLCQCVCELFSGVNIFDSDFGYMAHLCGFGIRVSLLDFYP